MFDILRPIKHVMGGVAAATGLYARDFRSKMVIAAFHRVNDAMPADGLTISSAKFEAFCRFFERHFRVVSLTEQVAGCRERKDMGGTLSITFDDGYLDNFEMAAPILRKLQLPATFFVSTGFMGSQHVAFWDRDLPIQPGWMQWRHVEELAAEGFHIGCHTVTHLDMGRASIDAIRSELRLSKETLEQRVGRTIDLFAYPFGGRNNITPQSLQLVREAGFQCCLSCYGGTNGAIADAYALKRIGIAEWFETPHQLGIEILMDKA